MDFAALLIVIELDDFLMCYPGQIYARKHFGDDFLQHEFTDREVQTLIKIKNLGKNPSYCIGFSKLIEKFTKYAVKYGVFLIVIMVNTGKW